MDARLAYYRQRAAAHGRRVCAVIGSIPADGPLVPVEWRDPYAYTQWYEDHVYAHARAAGHYANLVLGPALECTGPFSDAFDCPIHDPRLGRTDA